jgi:predicted Zn-dependent peptidase
MPISPPAGLAALAAIVLVAGGCATAPQPSAAPPGAAAAPAAVAPESTHFRVPVEYFKLDNGLRVVMSRDTTAPTVTVAVYYRIGFRIEPRGRTGFAHLFEHLMFQGSANLGKGEFNRLVESNGGVLNGSTRFDFTNYFEIVPANTLETILWAEADRMNSLAITRENLLNQQDVVKNEVRGNVLNRPYGGFPWLSMPQYANTNWFNAHNFYGDLDDIDAATLDEAQAFFGSYYIPGNAVLVVAGDFEPAQARGWITRYFGPIAARPVAPLPDVSEPGQEDERRHRLVDPLAPRPALALAWHVPPRGTAEHYAFGLLDELLLQGEDSALWQRIVREKGYAGAISGGINLLGNMFNYDGPMLWMVYLIHDAAVAPEQVIGDIDQVTGRLMDAPPDPRDMQRALTKIRTSLYDLADSSTRFGLVDLLASFALFDDDPDRINRIEDEFRKVTPELVQRVAREYLRSTNRTVLLLEPGAAQEAKP